MAAPTVGAVMADILPYLGVPRQFDAGELAAKEVIIEDLNGMSRDELQQYLKQQNLTAQLSGDEDTVTGQIPSAGTAVPGGSQLLVYFGDTAPETAVTVPDFSGMNRAQAVAEAGKLGLYILHSGNGGDDTGIVATTQNIPAGTSVSAGTTIQLEFTDIGARD
jgi:stage V sporulation protein D (sporulation-specific penicillin-binding protein)